MLSCLPLLPLLLCGLWLCSLSAASANLIVNGNFESGHWSPGWSASSFFTANVVGQHEETASVVACSVGFGCRSGAYYALFEGVDAGAVLSQTVAGLQPGRSYAFSFWLTGQSNLFNLIEVTVQLTGQQTPTPVVATFDFSSQYQLFSAQVAVPVSAQAPVHLNISFMSYEAVGGFGIDDVRLVPGSSVVGDPVFTGFQQQQFRVTGLPERVFNLISLRQLQLNSRFVALTDGQSCSAADMKNIRSLMQMMSSDSDAQDAPASASARSAPSIPPRTTAYNHPGTYLGSAGVKLSGHRLYVASGAYAAGFSNVSLDGLELPVAAEPVTLADGLSVVHSSPFSLTIHSSLLSLTLVNADHFLNIEAASLHAAYSSDWDIAGLLGQTADPAWLVQKSAVWRWRLERDHLLQGQDIFGDDFSGNRYRE